MHREDCSSCGGRRWSTLCYEDSRWGGRRAAAEQQEGGKLVARLHRRVPAGRGGIDQLSRGNASWANAALARARPACWVISGPAAPSSKPAAASSVKVGLQLTHHHAGAAQRARWRRRACCASGQGVHAVPLGGATSDGCVALSGLRLTRMGCTLQSSVVSKMLFRWLQHEGLRFAGRTRSRGGAPEPGF